MCYCSNECVFKSVVQSFKCSLRLTIITTGVAAIPGFTTVTIKGTQSVGLLTAVITTICAFGLIPL